MNWGCCIFLAFVCYLAIPRHAQSQVYPKREIRAVWLATASGLDWPKTGDRKSQQSALKEIVRTLHAAHFNTIYFQVRPRGDALYRSQHEPWSETLTGSMGKDPGWDPLAYLIEEAHANCIEVHAWFNVFKVRSGNSMLSPLHPARKFLEWTIHYQGEDWLDPGFPGVRTYTLTVLLDLVRRYDIDGVNFDYARYPGADFPDNRSYKQYGKEAPRGEWRIQNITSFISTSYDSIVAMKPWVKVGSSPLGPPGTTLDSRTALALTKYSQDAPAWLRSGKQDYVVPQIYWSIGGLKGQPDFAALAERWKSFAGDRQVVTGIAAFKSDVQKETARQIDTARTIGVAGQSFFRYENITGSWFPQLEYQTIAIPPPMPWKSSAIPRPPATLAATSLVPGVFYLEWGIADPSTSTPWEYVVYRSNSPDIQFSDPLSIIAVLPGAATSWIDTIPAINAASYYYAVSALSRTGNESTASRTVIASIQEIIALRSSLVGHPGAGMTIEESAGKVPVVLYRLPEDGKVSLELQESSDTAKSHHVETVFEEDQQRGIHVVPLDILQSRKGDYRVRLQAGESVEERVITMR